nr:unnamed protein product [Callosobruchus analis]
MRMVMATCHINGTELRGFVDAGCEVVIIRHSDAKTVGLKWNESEICLKGYGGSTTNVLGVSHADLEVDLLKTDVDIFIVPDHIQNVPVLIGTSLLNKENAITVVQKGTFSSELAELPQIEDLSSKKVKLVVKSGTEIPPNYVDTVCCTSNEDVSGDIFIDLTKSLKPNFEYVTPRSSNESYVPVLNVSKHPIRFDAMKVVARGERCVPEVSGKRQIENSDNYRAPAIAPTTDKLVFKAKGKIQSDMPDLSENKLTGGIGAHGRYMNVSHNEIGYRINHPISIHRDASVVSIWGHKIPVCYVDDILALQTTLSLDDHLYLYPFSALT